MTLKYIFAFNMNILYFYQYFSTSEGTWGTRVYEFTKRWTEQGHHVTVITSIYSKSDLRSNTLISDQLIEGIHVKVINVLIDNQQSVLKRIWTFAQYAMISAWYALTIKADVVIASSGPITVGIPGLVARLRGRKLVFEARDLWPEGAIKMGLLKNSMMIKLLYAFEKLCYKTSHTIIGLSPGIQQNIQARFPTCQVASVTNAANIELFSKSLPPPPSLQEGSYAIYFGNIGEVNHPGYLLDAASILLQQGRSDIQVAFIGEGPSKKALAERVEKEGLINVSFLNLMPKTALVRYVQHALVSVVPLKPIPVFDTSSPNKLFESMAAGVPVIQTTQGWIKDFLNEHHIGFTVNGQDPKDLADKLIFMKDNPHLTQEMGKRARMVAKKYFDKDFLADKMLGILKNVANQN